MLKDTLTSPDGTTSRKSLILMISFFVTILIAIWIVASEPITKIPVNDQAIGVFNSLLIFVSTLTGFTVVDKKISNQQPK